jgi:hypothetical protein
MIKVIFSSADQREHYIVSLSASISERTFIERAGVLANSYAGRLVSRLYEDLFMTSLDLKRDFDKYYRVEYAKFGEYLRKRHLLQRDDASEVEQEYSKSEAIVYYKHAYSFLEESVGENLLKCLLEPEEQQ